MASVVEALPAGLDEREAACLAAGDEVLLRFRGDGLGLPREYDGRWAIVRTVHRGLVVVRCETRWGVEQRLVSPRSIVAVRRETG
jgi:hypothetical protein